MAYRTKRPGMRKLLTFGAGATLAICQLGAGCVPADRVRYCEGDAAVEEGGNCVSSANRGDAKDGGGDAK